jgi:uncharacterized protein YutE (UPF0331/DUF86 family)
VTDLALVAGKLQNLREHLARAHERRPTDLVDFSTDKILQDALAMSLLVALQEAVDIAFHMIADEGWGIARSYADGFSTLAEHGVLSAELAHELGNVARLRNRLTHGYATVDFERLWSETPAGLDTLERFAAAVAGHLSQH